MDRLKFDASNPDLALIRQIMFKRLRDDQRDPNQGWRQLEDDNGQGFERYVEFPFHRHDAAQAFSMCVIDVFWAEVLDRALNAIGQLLGRIK